MIDYTKLRIDDIKRNIVEHGINTIEELDAMDSISEYATNSTKNRSFPRTFFGALFSTFYLNTTD